MFQKFRIGQWLSNQDSYGKPLALTYQKNKNFPTPLGGLCSILHISVAVTYLAFAIFKLQDPGWTVSAWLTAGVQSNGTTPVYQPGNKLVPAISLNTVNTTELPEEDLFSYFSIYFSIYHSNGSQLFIPAVNCADQLHYFNLLAPANQFCPNYTMWEEATLQNSVIDRFTFLHSFVSPCETTAPNYNFTTCKTVEESNEKTQYLFYTTSSYVELPSGPYAAGDTKDIAYADHPVEIGNSKASYQQLQVQVVPASVSYATNWFFASFNTINEINYNINQQVLITIPNAQAEQIDYIKDTIFNVQYRLSTSLSYESWSKGDAMAYISNFAGVMSLMIFSLSFFVAPIVDFSTDLEFISQLYTIKEKVNFKKDTLDNQINEQQTGENYYVRVPYSYPVSSQIGDFFKNSFCCCFKCCKCCQQSLRGNQFDKARNELYEEIDLVKIIQQLRTVQFLITENLRPRHHSIQKWFQDYQISSDEDEISSESDEEINSYKKYHKFEEPSFQEKVILSHLRKAKKVKKNFSRKEYFQYQKWRQDQHEILAINRIVQHIKPDVNKLDALALSKVTGKQVKNLSNTELELTTIEFKTMLYDNIDLIRQKNSKYSFLKKLNLDNPFSRALSQICDIKEKSTLQKKQTLLHQQTNENGFDETLFQRLQSGFSINARQTIIDKDTENDDDWIGQDQNNYLGQEDHENPN